MEVAGSRSAEPQGPKSGGETAAGVACPEEVAVSWAASLRSPRKVAASPKVAARKWR